MTLSIKSNFPLDNYNTFNISASTKFFFEFENENSIREILDNEKYKNENLLILGGGSNILFSKNFEGLILKNNIFKNIIFYYSLHG